ncbi:hypothetical protein BU14_0050s0004 [Porphyra umbilicalis]|uniref:Uncharacterized protein n=1 Tax=Porphyra umbilicalis TaxID=2786 RepID=A0A1X6PI40_PORUM|nr:hypothetical protein BU14_0050s0004 [Porphyra umbilicalis]|eukprot:OSX80531.1 hypothetical protein BU14_0050s0004 [Porphyra umbilicalis]
MAAAGARSPPRPPPNIVVPRLTAGSDTRRNAQATQRPTVAPLALPQPPPPFPPPRVDRPAAGAPTLAAAAAAVSPPPPPPLLQTLPPLPAATVPPRPPRRFYFHGAAGAAPAPACGGAKPLNGAGGYFTLSGLVPALPVAASVGTPAGRCVAAAAAAPGGLRLPPSASLGGTPGGPPVRAARSSYHIDAEVGSMTVGQPVSWSGAPRAPRSHTPGLGWLHPASAVAVGAAKATASAGRVPADVLLVASPFHPGWWAWRGEAALGAAAHPRRWRRRRGCARGWNGGGRGGGVRPLGWQCSPRFRA